MNIEIANRLFEMRKKNSLSQEELAEKIGVSRQAVSKWERAESSPDTDNLIELAKIYSVSLDELLFTTEPTEKPDDEDNVKNNAKPEFVSVSLDGVHVIEKDGSEVHVGLKGIRVKNKSNPDFDEDIEETWEELGKRKSAQMWTRLPVALIVTVVYLSIGFSLKIWHPLWLIFFIIPIYYSIVGLFLKK